MRTARASIITILALVIQFLAFHYLRPGGVPFYEMGYLAITVLIAVVFLFLTRDTSKIYRLDSLDKPMLLYAMAVAGSCYLGGVSHQYNLGLIFVVVTLVGLMAHPVSAVVSLVLFLAMLGSYLFNQLYHFIPKARVVRVDNQGDFLIGSLLPFASIALWQILLMGFRRTHLGSRSFANPSYPGEGMSQPPSSASYVQTPSTPVPGTQTSVIMQNENANADPTATQFFTRSYLAKQEAQTMEEVKGILNTVVYFMSRNFKAYTSLGLLASETGEKLSINAVVTKSKNFDHDCYIEFGKGILGNSVNKTGGFITGNLSQYPDRLEYYSGPEAVNSVMIQRIVDTNTKRLQGLLVVDSDRMRAFTDEHKELLNRFTQIASAMITGARLTHQMNKQAAWADTQYEISKKLSEVLKPEDVIEVLTESLMKIFDHSRLIICVYNASSRRGNIWNIIGDSGDLAVGHEFDIQNRRSLYGSVFRNRREMLVQGFTIEERYVRFGEEAPNAKRPEDMLIAPIHDDRQAVLAVVGIESDRAGTYSQTELRLLKTIMANVSTALTKARMYDEMEKLATIDGLTSIANHRKFQDVLSMELERAKRYSTALTLLLMDIDHFKQFNDTYGHSVGDLVLKMVARTLQGAIRSTDFCARYGGEEFVVLLVQADEEQSRFLAERIRKAIETTVVQTDDQELRVTVSIGSATWPIDAERKQDLIDNADKAMYHSKESGRNRVSFFSGIKPTGALK